ncbi:MAG TPA: ribosome maturation factor RimP [Candidatus Krumholzibacteria bacterium]|nr:ribosome maturation factor RimP [Candidatus Krumholzibacteria bacterium]
MSGPRISARDLEERFQEELALHGFELLEVETLHGGGRLTLRFVIDKPGGVTVDDCAEMDRAISRALEADEASLGRYVVEVSSPGIFRRLRRPEHFERYLGEWIKATVLKEEGSSETTQIRGRLSKTDEKGITLQPEDADAVFIARSALKNARLDPELKIGKPKKDTAAKGRKARGSKKGR